MEDNKTQMTFIQKIENYWYHYKWHTLFGIFAVILVAVCVVQCSSKTEPDAMIMYAGKLPEQLTPSKDSRDKTLEADVLKEDYNKDGEKRIEVFQLILPIVEIDGNFDHADKVAQTNLSERQRMHTEVANGTSVIYMLHPLLYEEVKAMGVLRPLSEVLDEVPEYAMDEYGIPISELHAYKRTNLRYYQKDTIICIRKERTSGAGMIRADDPEFYANNVSFFKDLMNF